MRHVHEDEIEYVEDEYGDAVPHLGGKPFTGVVRSELRGYVRETGYRDGEHHGWNRGYYPDGSRMDESRAEAGVMVGVAREWHPSGLPARESVRDERGRLVSRREWSAAGVLVREQRFDEDVWRDFYATGELLRERVEEGWVFHAPTGAWAFRHDGYGPAGDGAAFDHDAMAAAYPAMAHERECEVLLLRWVEERLAADRPTGVRALRHLIEHGPFRVAYRAVLIAVRERVLEAVPSLERQKDSPLETDDHPQLDHPLGHHATKALMELTVEDAVERGQIRHALARKARERAEARREAADSSAPWDRARIARGRTAPARLVESFQGRLEHTTADRIFEGERDVVKVDYWNVYTFESPAGWTYRVGRTTDHDPGLEKGDVQTVLFDPDDPTDAALLSEHADCWITLSDTWEEALARPIELDAWWDVVHADPELERGSDGVTAAWLVEPGAWFAWADGCVFTRNPTTGGLAKVHALAARLGATVHVADKGKPPPAESATG